MAQKASVDAPIARHREVAISQAIRRLTFIVSLKK
jgi:hypothetical protein